MQKVDRAANGGYLMVSLYEYVFIIFNIHLSLCKADDVIVYEIYVVLNKRPFKG